MDQCFFGHTCHCITFASISQFKKTRLENNGDQKHSFFIFYCKIEVDEDSLHMFQGVYTAIITPFKNDFIDYPSYFRIIDKQIQAGVSGVVPCGTTGESPTLTPEEHAELISETVKYVNKRIHVIGGTGSNSTKEAIYFTEKACKDGVDGVLSVNPYYNKPTQEGLFLHFKEINDSSSVPIMLYNIPGRTGVRVNSDVIIKLSQLKNIRSLKEATGDVVGMAEVFRGVNSEFTILSGDDALTIPMMVLGGKGVVSVVSNIFPRSVVSMVQFALNGNFPEAKKIYYDLFPIFQLAFMETNPIPIKTAMNWFGYCSDEIRLPMTKLSNNEKAKEFQKALLELKEKGFE